MSGTVLVCGGGAAGMMAAVAAARQGANVTLLERNDRNGKKLAITGKGRCNVTNAGDLQQLIAGLPGNGQFLYGALSRFSNRDMMAFLEELGLPLKVERGNRVFPVSDRAMDVVQTFEREMRRLGVLVLQGKKCDAILVEDGAVIGLKAGKEIFYGHKVILATGGASYPATGSDGSGCRMAPSRWAYHRSSKTLLGSPGFQYVLVAGAGGAFSTECGGFVESGATDTRERIWRVAFYAYRSFRSSCFIFKQACLRLLGTVS